MNSRIAAGNKARAALLDNHRAEYAELYAAELAKLGLEPVRRKRSHAEMIRDLEAKLAKLRGE